MTITIHPPCIITSRLLPGVKIGDATLSIAVGARDNEGRTRYEWYLDLPGGREFSGDDLRSGCQGGDWLDGLTSLLGFLSACGESVAYGRRTGEPGDNADLFPPEVAEWCDANSDELAIVSCELDGE